MMQTQIQHRVANAPNTPAFRADMAFRTNRGRSASAATNTNSIAKTSAEAAPATTMTNEEWGRSIAEENAVVVVSGKGCCMSHAVTRLLCSLGVNPRVVEIEGEQQRPDEVPAIFIGGRLLGGVDRLFAAHISGSLVPQLKEAGALWL